jgi:DNA-binding response OmpR family regulator
MAKILVVEDDADTAQMVKSWLTDEMHLVEIAADGVVARELLSLQKYDLIVLDWDLPRLSGLEVCRQFRNEGGHTPVLMLTGKGELSEKEKGLDSGADDYLTKPFQMRELSARLRALLRRPLQCQSTVLRTGNIQLDPTTCRVTKDGQEIELAPKEYDLLAFLMRYPGEIFSPDALLTRVWSTDSEATPLTVRVRITKLRSKLDSPGMPSLIRNVYNRGYMLEPPPA